MNEGLTIALVYNAALLLALSFVYEVGYMLPARLRKLGPSISGLIIGLVGMIIMATPFELRPGIVFDTRSILISVTALSFGLVPTVITVVITGVFRIIGGGVGVMPGLATILTSAIIGLVWRRWLIRIKPGRRWLNIYLFALSVHLAMLACMLLLPYPTSLEIIREIGWPVLLIYPAGSVLLCLLLFRQQERNEALIQRVEAEARYRSLFENNHAIMLLIEPESGCIIDANPAAERYYGWDRQTLKSMRVSDINILSADEIRQEMARTFDAQRDHFIFRHRRADGTVRDVEVYSGPIVIDGSKLLYSIVHDITERMIFERELAISEGRFRAVVEGAPDAIYIIQNEHFAYLNQTAITMFGAGSADQLIGRSVFERIQPEYHPIIRERIASILTRYDEMPPIVRRYIRLDGSTVEAEATSVPIVFNGAESILVFSRDISVRRQYEKEKVEVEAMLRQQQKMEAIGTLAGGVAHEINNPITGIMNYTQIMLDETDKSSPHAQYLKDILYETNRIAEIVRNLLQFSRQDRQTHSYARFDDIINQTVSLIRTIIRKDQIDLQLNIDPSLPEVKCRSQQIQQVLMNLLTNARDALNEKYPEYHENKQIILSCNQYEKDGRRWIRVDVEDHGKGIAEDIRQKMFEPFFSTKPKESGTGLGLTISFGIVRDHHGWFELDSKVGEYTKMMLHLPVDNGWDHQPDRQSEGQP